MNPISACEMKSHIANLPGENPSVFFAYSVWPTSSMWGVRAWLLISRGSSPCERHLPDERGRHDPDHDEPEDQSEPSSAPLLRRLGKGDLRIPSIHRLGRQAPISQPVPARATSF